MFDHFTTPEEIFSYKLGSALTMEQESLETLGSLEKAAMRSDLKKLFQEHAHETRDQIQNLEQCFNLIDQKANQAPSLAAKGLGKETNAFIAKTDDTLVDAVLLKGALEAEIHKGNAHDREPITQVPPLLPPGSI